MGNRIPLAEEPIAGTDAVHQYDKGAKLYMMPEYRFFVRKIIRKGIRSGRVLDIGTGSGLLAIELAKAKDCRFEVIALDISEDMISKARENTVRSGVGDKIRLFKGTAAALPFAENSFDLVVSYASLHHWFKPVEVFDEIARVTKKTGQAIIRDNKRVYQNPVWRAAISLGSLLMNKRHRQNWPKAIMASYTLSEARKLLERSRLSHYRVSSDFIFIDL